MQKYPPPTYPLRSFIFHFLERSGLTGLEHYSGFHRSFNFDRSHFCLRRLILFESYIPLSKRNANDSTYVTARVSKIDNECVQFGGPVPLHHKASIDSKSHGTEKVPSPEVFTLKSQPVHAYVPSAQNVNQVTDKQISDEEYDMDLEYLQMSFPGISVQSLTDVYLANKGDLDATIDMLNQLEFYSLETSEILPDTLDIGDVSEFGSSVDCASLKLKNIGGEANAASSSSKGSVTIS